jgi:hypothetical protein
MGRRRTQRADNTIRKLLLEEHRRNVGPGSRWHIAGKPPSDYERALAAGEAVLVSDSGLMRALRAAGAPYDDYIFGGKYFGKTFLLAEDGTLTEWTPEDG